MGEDPESWNCLDQIGLWVCLWGRVILIVDRYRKVQATVGSSIL